MKLGKERRICGAIASWERFDPMVNSKGQNKSKDHHGILIIIVYATELFLSLRSSFKANIWAAKLGSRYSVFETSKNYLPEESWKEATMAKNFFCDLKWTVCIGFAFLRTPAVLNLKLSCKLSCLFRVDISRSPYTSILAWWFDAISLASAMFSFFSVSGFATPFQHW